MRLGEPYRRPAHPPPPPPCLQGKTVLAAQQLDGLNPDEFSRLTINFSSATTSNTTQDIIEGALEKRSKNKMGPPSGKRMVLFVDDLNMPKKDTFGSQPPLELLRQWVDYGGWYDRGKQTWRFILDMQLLAAMGPPGGGRSVISERLQSRFNVVNFTFPCVARSVAAQLPPLSLHLCPPPARSAEKQVRGIFEAILAPKLADFSEEVRLLGACVACCSASSSAGRTRSRRVAQVKKLVPGLIAATVAVYERTVETFLPTPANAHYLFNLRDIARVVQGLTCANPREVDNKEGVLRLWSHETLRVFADRFTSTDDLARFRGIIE